MVYDSIASGHGSIPQLALAQVRRALDANWKVTCVCRDLEADLKREVEHLPLHVPRFVFAWQWLSARRNIRAALGGRSFDVLHVHQAQIADLGDVMQCHFLTRAAWQRGAVAPGSGWRGKINAAQLGVVMRAEDRYFRGVGAKASATNQTQMVFPSHLMLDEFTRLYGEPPRSSVIVNACPPADFSSDEERRSARRELAGDTEKPVVGFLGGVDERKGFGRLVEAIKSAPDLFLLWGGPHSQNHEIPSLRGRCRSLGMVRDTNRFYAACDVLLVPSVFEPFGLVATEAAARGVPVIATEEVGALRYLLEFGAGMSWQPPAPLSPLVREAIARRAEFNAGAREMCVELREEQNSARLFALYEHIRERKRVATT